MPDSAIRRRLLESRMEARESQLQLAATHFGCGTWTLEPNTGELHCSAHALTLLGLPADAQPNFDALLALVHADDRERLSNAFARALSVRNQFELEFALDSAGKRSKLLRCLGRSHSSALDQNRFALSGILLPVAHDADGLITLDSERLAAMILRQESLCALERSTLVTRLQAEMIPKARALLQHITALASNPTLAASQQAQVDTMLETANAWLDTLRAMIFDLQPPGVPELGFCGALERHARETAASAGLELTLSLPAEPLPLTDAALDALYQAARAGIDNVARHAHAQRLGVSMQCTSSRVLLEISDDGDGIRSADLARQGALGLFASSARLGVCGGTLRVRRRPAGGTLLQVSIALDPGNQLERRASAAGHAS